jgi:hypothetical protein
MSKLLSLTVNTCLKSFSDNGTFHSVTSIDGDAQMIFSRFYRIIRCFFGISIKELAIRRGCSITANQQTPEFINVLTVTP